MPPSRVLSLKRSGGTFSIPGPAIRSWRGCRTLRRWSASGRGELSALPANSLPVGRRLRRRYVHANSATCRGYAASPRRSKSWKNRVSDKLPDLIDVAAREHAIAFRGSVLVQAPAGSGKTTLLAQRYLRLLALVDAPERILALTFTRRAAQEMRQRVMQALQAPSSELGAAAKRHMDRLKLDLERHPSRLRIETIDAFNAWLAGQLPITAGAGSRLNLVG